MRTVNIDGKQITIKGCCNCPFMDGGDGGYGENCQYPFKPSKLKAVGAINAWSFEDSEPDDCPLERI